MASATEVCVDVVWMLYVLCVLCAVCVCVCMCVVHLQCASCVCVLRAKELTAHNYMHSNYQRTNGNNGNKQQQQHHTTPNNSPPPQQFVLTGGSAGGLSTFLHSDRVAARVRAGAPGIKKIRSAPVVGYVSSQSLS